MYSSLDNPTRAEWLEEKRRLDMEISKKLDCINRNFKESFKNNNTFTMKYYCQKLHKANEALKIGKVGLDEEVEG